MGQRGRGEGGAGGRKGREGGSEWRVVNVKMKILDSRSVIFFLKFSFAQK